MKDNKMAQLFALAAISLVCGFFIWTGMFAVFAWLWWFLLIGGVSSFIRACDIPFSVFS